MVIICPTIYYIRDTRYVASVISVVYCYFRIFPKAVCVNFVYPYTHTYIYILYIIYINIHRVRTSVGKTGFAPFSPAPCSLLISI